MACLVNGGRGGREEGDRRRCGGGGGSEEMWGRRGIGGDVGRRERDERLCEGGKGWLAYYVTMRKNRSNNSVAVYSERAYGGFMKWLDVRTCNYVVTS